MTMQSPLFHKPLLSSLVLSMMLVGCASTPKPTANVNDPWTGWNHGTQTFNDNLDKAIIKPLAKGYHWVTPDLVNQGISNFFSNINDIGVTANDIMQLKLSQGGQDAVNRITAHVRWRSGWRYGARRLPRADLPDQTAAPDRGFCAGRTDRHSGAHAG